MALLKAIILFLLLGNSLSLLVPDSDGTVKSITGDDIVQGFNLKSPITFSGQGGNEETIQTLYVSFIFVNIQTLYVSFIFVNN